MPAARLSAIPKDLSSTILNQGWKIIAGPVVLLLIPLFLTAQIQGYWYAFVSIAAMSAFADLGFSNIVLQFSAHEFAHLSYSNESGLNGSLEYRMRLSSLLRFVLKWVGAASAIFYPAVFGIGVLLFQDRGARISWLLPWTMYCAFSALIFASMTLLSFIEGCNEVAGAQRIRFAVAFASAMVSSVGLVLHLKLFALSLGVTFAFLVFVALTVVRYGRFLREIFRTPQEVDVRWSKTILRLLWRTAISYSSGYVTFQIYTPIMFKFHGPVDAGQVGISISLWTAIFSLSSTWITAVTPRANMLVAARNWGELDRLIKNNITRSIITFCCLVLVGLPSVGLLQAHVEMIHRITMRFVPPFALATLGVGWFFQVIINGLAVYLRAHKQEPFVLTSISSAFIIAVGTVLSARFLPAELFFVGFVASYAVVFPWILTMFFKLRRQWHSHTNPQKAF